MRRPRIADIMVIVLIVALGSAAYRAVVPPELFLVGAVPMASYLARTFRPRLSPMKFGIIAGFAGLTAFGFYLLEFCFLAGINTSGREPWEPLFWFLIFYGFPSLVFAAMIALGLALDRALTDD